MGCERLRIRVGGISYPALSPHFLFILNVSDSRTFDFCTAGVTCFWSPSKIENILITNSIHNIVYKIVLETTIYIKFSNCIYSFLILLSISKQN